jgi:hypothetical protein
MLCRDCSFRLTYLLNYEKEKNQVTKPGNLNNLFNSIHKTTQFKNLGENILAPINKIQDLLPHYSIQGIIDAKG